MCIIVDPPAFIPMFKTADPEHFNFLPVKIWVSRGPGKFVMGGSKYNEELRKVSSVLSLLSELERQGKVIKIINIKVDKDVEEIKIIEPNTDFDDPHLIALVRITGCKLICVRDPRSHKYLKQARFYPSPTSKPKLYTKVQNQNLLSVRNIPSWCK